MPRLSLVVRLGDNIIQLDGARDRANCKDESNVNESGERSPTSQYSSAANQSFQSEIQIISYKIFRNILYFVTHVAVNSFYFQTFKSIINVLELQSSHMEGAISRNNISFHVVITDFIIL